VTVFVHLIEGDCAQARLARIHDLARAARRPPIIMAEGGSDACSPMEWLMGPSCTCCLPARHPRLRLMQATAQPQPSRILIDAGPPAMADRIIAALRALPVQLHLNVVTAGNMTPVPAGAAHSG
jgi:hypothetical protein